jgi:hypothetical protein
MELWEREEGGAISKPVGSGRDWTRQGPKICDMEAPRASPGGYCDSGVTKGDGGDGITARE